MHITFNQLRVFREVATQNSITKAAQVLHMTQPAVSMQVKQLEDQVGLPLIEVISKKLNLTEAGNLVLASAHKMKDELQFLRDSVTEFKGGMQGNLKIGAVTTAQHFLPHLMGKFHHNHPAVKLALKIRNREEVLQRLYGNLDDIAVLSQLPDDKRLIAEKILDDQLVLVAPQSSTKTTQSLKNLNQSNWLIREAGSGTRMVMQRFFAEHHFTPKIAMELGSTESIIEAISAGIGISILPRSALPHDLDAKNLSIIALAESLPEHAWFAVHLKDKKLLPAARNFLATVAKMQL